MDGAEQMCLFPLPIRKLGSGTMTLLDAVINVRGIDLSAPELHGQLRLWPGTCPDCRKPVYPHGGELSLWGLCRECENDRLGDYAGG